MSELDPMSVHRDCLLDRCWRDEPSPCALFDAISHYPVVAALEYVVYPSRFARIPFADRDSWCLYVFDGGWGWSVRNFPGGQGSAMNRRGEFIHERRGHKGNQRRRYSLDEALALARRYVDHHKRNGRTAAEVVES